MPPKVVCDLEVTARKCGGIQKLPLIWLKDLYGVRARRYCHGPWPTVHVEVLRHRACDLPKNLIRFTLRDPGKHC